MFLVRSIWGGGCLCLLLLAGCGGTPAAPQPRRVIFVTNGNSPFFDVCAAGLKAADKDLNFAAAGLHAVMDVNDGTPQGQLTKLRQYGSQGDVAGVAISVVDAKNAAVAEEMRALRKKGVQVLCVDSDIDREKFADARFAFIGTNNFLGGSELGQCAKQLLPDGAQYVTFVGRTGAQNAQDRINGFAQGAGNTFQSQDSMGDDFDRTRARDNVRKAIQNHPQLKCLVGIYSYNAPAIVDVLKETNRRKDFTVVTFDAEPVAISELQAGMIDAMVVQNPYQMGYQSARLIQALVAHDEATVKEMFPRLQEPEGNIYDTGLKVVVPQKSPLRKEPFGPKTEFLTVSEFQAWLQKYGLSGS